jgi:hypothetical protein
VERKLAKAVPRDAEFPRLPGTGLRTRDLRRGAFHVEISGPTSVVDRVTDVTTDFVSFRAGRRTSPSR